MKLSPVLSFVGYSCKFPLHFLNNTHRPNPYPVIEDPKGPNSLTDAVIKAGYSVLLQWTDPWFSYTSHYVCVDSKGMPAKATDTDIYDEFIVSSESHVLQLQHFLLIILLDHSCLHFNDRSKLYPQNAIKMQRRSKKLL